MTLDKQGLVGVTDRGAKKGRDEAVVTHYKMHPVDVKETFERGGLHADGGPRYVLTEDYGAEAQL